MRLTHVALGRSVLLALALALAGPAMAKFGISKTRVTLRRTRPPEIALVGDTVKLEVASRARSVSEGDLDAIRARVAGALAADGSRRLVDHGADTAVRVSVDDLDARIEDTVIYEEHYVKTGEREEWDAKKNRYVKKDVYGYRRQPVRLRTARGRVAARVDVEGPRGQRSADAGAAYDNQFKGDVRLPEEAASESLLERYLVDEAARRAAAAVAFSADPVEALLAVDGELKDGNRLAQSGLWKEALAAWTARPLKGDTEAARLHNVGVAHEAMAYALPIDGDDHRAALQQAADFYRRAIALDPGEKYFAEAAQRIQASLEYADTAQRYAEDAGRWRARPSRRAEEEGIAPGKLRAEARDALGASAALATPLRNGSFESGLEPWTVAGKGTLVDDPHRGRVFQALGGAATSLAQAVSVDVDAAPAATVAFEYKVTAGEGRLHVLVAYEDAKGAARAATLEVTGGDPPGAWTPWEGELLSLRPRPSRVREVRIVSEGGTVLLDNVALTLH